MSEPDYVILTATAESLPAKVKAKRDEGWQLLGTPFVTGRETYDVMVRGEGETFEAYTRRCALLQTKFPEFAQAMTKGLCDDPLLAVGEQMVRKVGANPAGCP